MVEVYHVTNDPNTIPLDIIVLAHNRWELTKDCLDSLYQYTSNPFHLIIIDDSTDLTPLHIAELLREHDNVTSVHSDEPYKSGNQCINIGLSKCRHDFVAIIGNSTTVQPEWTIGALLVFMGEPKAATVGLKCLLPWGTIESAGIDVHTYMDYSGVKVAGYTPIDIGAHLPSHLLSLNYERNAVQWSLAIHRREALVGNLDENIYHGFAGWDDIDNCFVLRQKGWKIFYCGSGSGYHIPHATRGTDDPDDQRFKNNRLNGDIFRLRWGLQIEQTPIAQTPRLQVEDIEESNRLMNRAGRRKLRRVKGSASLA